MTKRARILVMDRAGGVADEVRLSLAPDGHVVSRVQDETEALEALRSGTDLFIVNVCIAPDDRLESLAELGRWSNGAPCLVLSGCGPMGAAARMLFPRAEDVLPLPFGAPLLRRRVAEVLEHAEAQRKTPTGSGSIIGRSDAMKVVNERLSQAARFDSTVLITGETGSGKGLVARTIHDLSARRDRPFVVISCAELSETLLESELFGHVRGSFTGATRDRPGLFEVADGGTVLLDEVSDSSREFQTRLLRVVEDREIRPVGAVRSKPVDIRIIAASQRDLRREVEAGRVREDLYYRLKVFEIALPPLRQRVEDIPLLTAHALREHDQSRDSTFGCTGLVHAALRAYPWPGNVRELFAVLEGATIVARGGVLEVSDLPATLQDALRASLTEDNELDLIRQALEEAGGNRTRAAEVLGMGRTTLWRRMRHYGLQA